MQQQQWRQWYDNEQSSLKQVWCALPLVPQPPTLCLYGLCEAAGLQLVPSTCLVLGERVRCLKMTAIKPFGHVILL